MIAGVNFDHFSVAAHDRTVLDARYARDFGCTYLTGGETAGLSATIVKFANGVKLETIEPHDVEHEDFLLRFLQRSGPGFHHITFVVGDVTAAADETEARGYRLMGSRTTTLSEVFVHPKDAHGVVVQYIESRDYVTGEVPAHFPDSTTIRSELDHIALVVASLDRAKDLFIDVLGGNQIAEAQETSGRWAEVAWRAPGTIRLIEPAPGTGHDAWLAGRPGAMHHFAITTDDPAQVPGARRHLDGTWRVAPAENWGVALHLRGR